MARNRPITEHQSPAEQQFRRRQIGGLLLIMAMIVAGSIFHAGVGQLFPPGWWRIW